MLRTSILSVMLMALWLSATAQRIETAEAIHDFGSIQEADGKVQHEFTIKNTGDKPLIIKNVNASCGCTTPAYSSEPIKPGANMKLKVEFDPAHRGGQFTKNIRVYSNAGNGELVLYIKGTVVPTPPSIDETYRQSLGDLKFKSIFAAFSKITNTQVETQELEFYNPTDAPITIEVKQTPDYIKVEPDPAVVKPKQQGRIRITYDATKANTFGYIMHYIFLKLNGDDGNKYRIMVNATISEDFSKLSAKELANAPHAVFENATVQDMGQYGKQARVEHDFGSVAQGQNVEYSFKFRNTGKTDLIVRNTKASCGCTAVAPTNNVIKPGETGEIKATFHTDGRSGPQSKAITVTVNDPNSPTVKLYLKGIIK